MKNRDGYKQGTRVEAGTVGGCKKGKWHGSREKGDGEGARKEVYTCRAREETRERSSGRAGNIDSRGWLVMATTLLSRLDSCLVLQAPSSPSNDSRFSNLSTPPGPDR